MQYLTPDQEVYLAMYDEGVTLPLHAAFELMNAGIILEDHMEDESN